METENKAKNNESSEIRLDRKSKVLFIVIAFLIAGAITITFWRIVLKRDYIVQAQTDCDPTTENCFIWKCDPSSTEEGEACTGDPETDTWYYKIVRRNAKNIPLCDPNADENCDAYTCVPDEKDCSDDLCTPENVSEGESCNDPVQYNIDNPPEEEFVGEECAPDDQECIDAQGSSEECAPDDEECLQSQEAAPSDEQVCAPGDEICQQNQNEEAKPGASSDAKSDIPESSSQ